MDHEQLLQIGHQPDQAPTQAHATDRVGGSSFQEYPHRMNTNTLSQDHPEPMTAKLEADGGLVLEVEHQAGVEDEELSLVDALRVQDSVLRLIRSTPKS